MRRAIIAFVCAFIGAAGVAAYAQTVSSSAPVSVLSVVPTSLTNGKLQLTINMSDGTSTLQTTLMPVNGASVLSYDPTVYAISTGSTSQLSDGYTVYRFSGSGTILAATVKLPANPTDGQVARLVFPSGLTVTTMTIQSGSGSTVGAFATVMIGATPLFQSIGGTWVRVD